jgi:hypothetical protein
MSRVVVPPSSLSGSVSPLGTGPNLRLRPLIYSRNATTYLAATLHIGCGRGLVPKNARVDGPRGQALAAISAGK